MIDRREPEPRAIGPVVAEIRPPLEAVASHDEAIGRTAVVDHADAIMTAVPRRQRDVDGGIRATIATRALVHQDARDAKVAQVQAREHLKAIYVGLGGKQDALPADADEEEERGRAWTRQGKRASSVSPSRPMADLMAV